MTRGIAIALLAVTSWLMAACGMGATAVEELTGDAAATVDLSASGSLSQIGAQEIPSATSVTSSSANLEDSDSLALLTSPDDWSVPPESIPDGESRLYVKFEGVENTGIPIRNGGLVHLGGGLDAEVFVDPYPTDNLTAWLDLYLELDGRPVSDAHTVILYDMWSMGHGPYVGKSDAAIDGHYVFRLDYIMFGAWEQVLEVRMPGSDEVERLTVIIVAVP